MTVPTPAVPLARIGSEVEEFLIPPPPQLSLVRETSPTGIRSLWVPLICSTLVVGASFLATPTLTDSLTGKAANGARLTLSNSYQGLAPICNTLDTISMFSQGQHLAFLLTFAVVLVAWRLVRRRRGSTRSRVRDELFVGARALIALIGVYIVGAMLPRPTARLTMAAPDAVVIDFHSHTRYSWDGRAGFSPEQSRRWHKASGFDVAYITDHSTFAGAEEAALDNPVRAGDGTVMLSGIEVRDRGNHLAVLGTDAGDWRSYTAGDLHEHIFESEAEARGTARPVVLFTLPGNLKAESAMAVDGIELSDAAPRGLAESDGQREKIVGLAHEQKKSLVASSNNHGWASASPAWSVMQIHDWRAMTPAQLDVAIRRQILNQGSAAVEVIDRRARGPISFVGLALTVPVAAWRMLQTISWAERISWLIWIWAIYAVTKLIQKIRGREHSEAQPEEPRDFTSWRSAAGMV